MGRALLVAAACTLFAWIPPGAAQAGDRPIVAVFQIEDKSGKLSAKAIDQLTDYLGTLLATRGYQVVPRSELRGRLTEAKKGTYQPCFDQSCQIEIGKELAAQKSLASQVLKIGAQCKVSVSLFDLKKAASEAAGVASGGCGEDGVLASLDRAVASMLSAASKQAETAALEWLPSRPAGIELTRSEVTVAQYRACVEAGKCEAAHFDDGTCTVYDGKSWELGKLPVGMRGDAQPVVCVDWYQANLFCVWAGGRLPTEQEWYAEASNGGKQPYPWGEPQASCERAIWNQGGPGCGKGWTWPVCSKPAGNSASGLCDLGGNVWEWTSSSEGAARVLRGGSWRNGYTGDLLAANRAYRGPTDRLDDYGFRCVRSGAP